VSVGGGDSVGEGVFVGLGLFVGAGVSVGDGVGVAVGEGATVGEGSGGATEIDGPIEWAESKVGVGNGIVGCPCIAADMKVCQISAGIVPP
jgi:hypothetical protein